MTQQAKIVIAGELAAMLWLTGCAYRLMAPVLPSQQRLHIVASSPERYSVRVQDSFRARVSEYHVPADGRVRFDIPIMPRGCDVLVFGIPISRAADPAKARLISIVAGQTTVEMLSMRDLDKLPVDAAGDQQLELAAKKPLQAR
jgi:hypothetical protein